VITPQGSSANLLFVGSGFLNQGALPPGRHLDLLLSVDLPVVGTPWLMLVCR